MGNRTSNGQTPPYRRLPPEVRRAVIADLQSGRFGRNEIARRNNIGNSTVNKIADEEGLSTTRKTDITREATKAMQVDNRARREMLKEQMYGDIQRLRVRAWSRWEREVVTKEGIETLSAEMPPLPEVLAAYKAIQINLDGIFKLEALEAAQGSTNQDAKDFLLDLHSQITKVTTEFEARTGVPMDSEQAQQIIRGELAERDGEGDA